MTPPETLSYRDKENQKWRVRVISNQFPALSPEGNTARKLNDDFFISMDGMGIHEVVIETPEHNKALALQEKSGVVDILHAYRERYNAMIRVPFVKLVIIYKNYGPMAGTTLEHSHSQLVATPVIPKQLRTQHKVAARYYGSTGSYLYADMVSHEIKSGKRIVMETGSFVAFHPFASHSAFETWIVPKVNQSSFGDISTNDLEDLAHILRIILLKLHRGLNNPDFNYVINSAPAGDEDKNCFRWHMRIIPRLIELSGFEIGSGINMNAVVPEETAKFMREMKVG